MRFTFRAFLNEVKKYERTYCVRIVPFRMKALKWHYRVPDINIPFNRLTEDRFLRESDYKYFRCNNSFFRGFSISNTLHLYHKLIRIKIELDKINYM